MILIVQGTHHHALRKEILMKDGPLMNDLITRNIPFHLRGSVTDSLLTLIVENFHLMIGVVMNIPLETNSLIGGAMTVFIQDPLIILILVTEATHLHIPLTSFVGHTHLVAHFCHSPLVDRNLMRGGPLDHHCPPSTSQRLRLYLRRRYLIYPEEMNGQVM